MSLLLRGGLVEGKPGDVLVRAGRIEQVGLDLSAQGAEVLDVGGQLVLPGLHDHHLHLRALAAATGSVAVGPPEVRDRRQLSAALDRAGADCGGLGGWIRAVGYHESVAGPLDRRVLDVLGPSSVPIRVQHRSGVLWTVNSLGARLLDLDRLEHPGVERDPAGRPTGRLHRMDDWLRGAVPAVAADLGAASARLASLGVTGITEATPDQGPSDLFALVEASESGRILQRLCLMCPAELELPEGRLVSRGPHKILLDDPTLPGPEALAAELRRAHRAGQPVAVHCVTLVQLVVTLEGLRLAGSRPGDRIEHASVVLPEQFEALSALGVTIVTNPSFVAERGDDYLAEVEPEDRAHLYRCASLIRAGIPVAAGTDAPLARADPWLAMAAAVGRRTRSGRPLGPEEALDPVAAFSLFSGAADRPARPRRVRAGGPADLCILRRPDEAGQTDHTGLAGRPVVTATVVAGKLVHRPSL